MPTLHDSTSDGGSDSAATTQPAGPAGNCAGSLKGVEFDKAAGRWRARITVRGRKHSLGSFVAREEASR
jgi:hypothetical protein